MNILPATQFLGRAARRSLLAVTLAVSAFAPALAFGDHPVSAAGGLSYVVTDLGVLVGQTASQAYGINNAGQVVGYSGPTDGSGSAFLWTQRGGITDLGAGINSWAYAINNASSPQVAVTASYPTTTSSGAEIWQDGVFTDPGTAGTSRSYAFAINDSGWLVGQVYQNFCECAALWHDGTLTNLGSLANAHSAAAGVNNAGAVVGGTETTVKDSLGNTIDHAFEWTQNGGMVDLTPGSADNSSASAINQTGIIVGEGNYSYVTATSDAVLWQNGSMTSLGTLGGARADAAAINNLSAPQVVGTSDIVGGGQHAFLWQDGTMTDLNSLIPSTTGWVLTGATGINDNGQIVGVGAINGQMHAYLLTPVTATSVGPSSLSFGNRSVGSTSTAQTVTVTNTGSAILDVTGISLTGANPGDFSQTNTCNAFVAPGNSCAISVMFSPQATGARSATLTITDNTSDSPQTVSLSGTGQSTDLGIAMTASASRVKSGSSLAYSIAITNAGPGTADGVAVTDSLPSGEILSSASPGCALSGTTVMCPIGSMMSGSDATASITVTVTATKTNVTNTATVTAATLDSNSANNTASVTTKVYGH